VSLPSARRSATGGQIMAGTIITGAPQFQGEAVGLLEHSQMGTSVLKAPDVQRTEADVRSCRQVCILAKPQRTNCSLTKISGKSHSHKKRSGDRSSGVLKAKGVSMMGPTRTTSLSRLTLPA